MQGDGEERSGGREAIEDFGERAGENGRLMLLPHASCHFHPHFHSCFSAVQEMGLRRSPQGSWQALGADGESRMSGDSAAPTSTFASAEFQLSHKEVCFKNSNR